MSDFDNLIIEADGLARAEAAMATLPDRWKEAVERAQQQPAVKGPDGFVLRGLNSVWTAPVERLVQEQEHLLRLAGVDPATVPTPKPKKMSAEEKAMPPHVRLAYRRGAFLRGHLDKVLAAKKRDLAKAEEQQRKDSVAARGRRRSIGSPKGRGGAE